MNPGPEGHLSMFHISVRFQDTAETLLQRVTAQAPAALRGGESMKNLSEKMLSFLPVRDVRKKSYWHGDQSIYYNNTGITKSQFGVS